ncbi:sensor histidine kinase [Streptomyces radicis]|uniref:sensor histidine kinase n=1 Tax=Streptomyces radicis TaxID=1750517 RepID=UPI0016018BA1|nr:histidine kinase [Streptomyces radicis]
MTSYRLVSSSVTDGFDPADHPVDLALFSCSTLLLIAVLGVYAQSVAIAFVGIASLVLRLVLAVLLCLPVLGVAAAVLTSNGFPPVHVLTVIAAAVTTGGACYFLGWLAFRYREMLRAASWEKRAALVEERLRFARDLHDILGHSLSVIALQSELASRLVGSDPEHARGALKSVADLSRRSIADVREVVVGYRMPPLAAEIDEVAAVLRAAGVAAEVSVPREGVPQPVEQALGWVAREATTNILRHSDAGRCLIRLSTEGGRVLFEVRNDGAGRGSREGGSGLVGLRSRVEAVGGTLTWGHDDGSWYGVRADIPLGGVPDGCG